jgi:hypothetical protein
MNAANLSVAQMINGLDADLQLLWERFLRVDILVRWLEDICDNARPARAWPNIGRSMRLPRLPSARRQELCDAINKLEESLVAGLGNLWTSMRTYPMGSVHGVGDALHDGLMCHAWTITTRIVVHGRWHKSHHGPSSALRYGVILAPGAD